MIVYLIFANADMTEGRGPMVIRKIMHDKQKAIDFALKQFGVMGCRDRQTRCDKPYRDYYFGVGRQLVEGDWEVIEVQTE